MILRKWYFCVNEAGFDGSRPLIAAAVASCLANTSLRPFGIYNGNDASHVSWLEARGVTVVRHRSSLEDDLRLAYGDRFNQFSGHWLRIDLPLIETEEEAVLYTDNDVMFLREPEINAVPRLLSAAPEFELTKLSYFNSGVMVLNLPSLRRVHEAFTGAIRRRLRGDFRYPAHDQESYNRFFGPRVLNRLQGRTFTPMSPTLNWKPYWGLNPEAQIVHFHGPKPRHIQKFVATEGPSAVSDLYRTLWRRSPETYAVYVAQWGTYLGELGRRRAKVAKVVEVPTLRNG
jgi:hypothetical protein